MASFSKTLLPLLLLALIIFSGVSAGEQKTDKAQRALERKANRRKLESCLTLVRSLYTHEEKTIQDFVMAHPTVTKDRLMNKILSHMMITCSQNITPEQIEVLQKQKDEPSDFDWSQKGYSQLLDFNLNKFAVDESLPEDKQKGPVEMSKDEIRMQTIVEDLSEDMKREREEEIKEQRGGISFFFFDLSNMSTTTSLLYVLGIMGFFGVIFYVLITKLMEKPVDFQKQKRNEKLSKKSSSKGSSGKKVQ